MKPIAIIALAAYVTTYYGIILLLPDYALILSDFMSPLGELAALTLIVWSIKRLSPSERNPWILFGITIIGYLLGDMIWTYQEVFLQQDMVFPSLSDIFYTISIFTCFIAVGSYLSHQRRFLRIRSYFDVAITMVVCTTLSWVFVTSSIAEDSSLDALSSFFSLVYPISDLGLIGFVLLLYFSNPPDPVKQTVNRMLIIAFIIWLFADQSYALQLNLGEYSSGAFIDPLWPVGIGILSLASLWAARSARIPADSQPGLNVLDNPGNISYWFRLMIPYVSFAGLMGVSNFQYFTDEPLVLGSVIAALLIIVRQVFTIVENDHLLGLLSKNKQELEDKNLALQTLHDAKEEEARTDYLTGLPNRRHVDDRLNRLRREAHTSTWDLYILMLDVDNFKSVNDEWGHSAGDLVLQKISSLIKANIRAMDIAGRLGGDEFIVILPESSLELAQSVGERLRARISAERFTHEEKHRYITVSIGGSKLGGSKALGDLEEMRFRGDSALYLAKSSGGNIVIVN